MSREEWYKEVLYYLDEIESAVNDLRKEVDKDELYDYVDRDEFLAILDEVQVDIWEL